MLYVVRSVYQDHMFICFVFSFFSDAGRYLAGEAICVVVFSGPAFTGKFKGIEDNRSIRPPV